MEKDITKPKKFNRQPNLPKDFWLSKVGQKFHHWKLISVDKRSLRSPAMRQTLICECTRCGHKSRLKAYSVWQGRTRQCQHCKKRKIWPPRILKGKELNLYFIWKKKHKIMIPEWKNDFNKFRDYCINDMKYMPNRKYMFWFDKSKPIGPDNWKHIPFKNKKQPI